MKKIILLSLSVLVLLTGCKKEKETKIIEEQKNQSNESSVVESQPLEVNLSFEEKVEEFFKQKEPPLFVEGKKSKIAEDKISTKPVIAEAHKKYLKDEMKFTGKLNDFGITDKTSYLVRGNNCYFYSEDILKKFANGRYALKKDANLKTEKIPLGTILPVYYEKDGKTPVKYLNGEGDSDMVQATGMFSLFNCDNWFFKTKWNGKEGIVFGAYIALNKTNENKVDSMYYATNAAPDKFYPVCGYDYLVEDETKSLEKNKLLFENTTLPEYFGEDEYTHNYKQISSKQSEFVTTDLFAYSQHRVFDNILASIEEDVLEDKLRRLTQIFIKEISKRDDVDESIKTKAIEYFQVPELILITTPIRSFDEVTYSDVYSKALSLDDVGSNYPKEVIEDYKQIMSASGMFSNVFGTKEDFSQYKPRGHYTKNKALEGYFKASMWYGRIHFCIAQSDVDTNTFEETKKMLPVAMLIVDTVNKNPYLYDEWKSVFDPITAMIGFSDDLGFEEVLPVWKEQKVSDLNAWSKDEKKIEDFVKICHQKLRPPAISSNTVLFGPSEGADRKAPMGWRFLGQRFTYDSDIHSKVSAPRIEKRTNVRGLDIMKAFGSKAADTLLEKTDYKYNKDDLYSGGKELKTVLDKLQTEIDSYPVSFWIQSYYNSVLATIKAQANFEQGAGFYFTETPMWDIKSLNSAHSTWASLRHDTILYVIQCVAECGGGEDYEPSYDYVNIPDPINYIEPNLNFWQYSLVSVQKLKNILIDYDILTTEAHFVLEELESMYSKIIDIVNLEINDKFISKEDNYWITTISRELSLLIVSSYAGVPRDSDFNKMSCIADVFTNADTFECLEVGIGPVYKMYIALNDCQGGKRIAVGYIPSYYEFYNSITKRMTDEEWKIKIYKNKEDLNKYKPFWIKDCVLDLTK